MDESLYEKLLNSAFRFVSYRPRSEKEIRIFLENKLYRWKTAGKASLDKVIGRLRDYGYIDDKKFVQWWVQQRQTFRPKSTRLVSIELRHKGVNKDLVDQLLKISPEEELKSAKRALEKKLVSWSSLPFREQKKKIYAYLERRGFSSAVIGSIIDEISPKE